MANPVSAISVAAPVAPSGPAAPPQARGPGFALPVALPAPPGAPPALAPTALSSLLALQETNRPERPDARHQRQARRRLDLLRRLQMALLSGTEDPAALRELADLRPAAGAVSDAGLDAVLGAIALRARVELARRRGCA